MTTDQRRRLLRLAVGGTVLVAAVAVTGVDAGLVGLRSIDLLVVVAATALAVPATIACAWRWRLVAEGLGVRISLGPAVMACYRAQFLNTTVPGGVAGDVLRGVAHGREAGAVPRALRAVLVERLAGQVVLVGIAVVVLPTTPLLPAAPGAVVAVTASVAVVTLAAAARLVPVRAWPGVVLASLVGLACNVATFVVAARAVGLAAPVTTLVPLVLVVFLAAALPTNVAGWGPREGMAAWAFGAAGLGAEQGLAAAVAFGVAVLVANAPGAVLLVLRNRAVGRPATGAGLTTAGGSRVRG